MNVLSEDVIIDAEAKSMLQKREKESDLKYEQKNALEILNKSVKLDLEKGKVLVEELKKIEKLRDREAVEIVNFMPEDRDDLRTVMQKDYNSLTDDEINLVLETVKKYS